MGILHTALTSISNKMSTAREAFKSTKKRRERTMMLKFSEVNISGEKRNVGGNALHIQGFEMKEMDKWWAVG